MYNAKMKINTVTVTTVPVTSVFYSWYVCFVSLESFLLSVFHQQVVTPCAFAIIHLLHYCLEKKVGVENGIYDKIRPSSAQDNGF